MNPNYSHLPEKPDCFCSRAFPAGANLAGPSPALLIAILPKIVHNG
jgi:hypothetical protein